MHKLNRKIITFISTIIFFLSFGNIIYASVNPVIDKAKLLSDNEKSKLVLQIEEIRETYNIDVVIVTTNSLEGKSIVEYADDYYDDNGYGIDEDKSGLLLLIDMKDRKIYISTTGKAKSYFTDRRLDSMIADIGNYLKNSQYYDGCNSYLGQVKHYIELGIPEGQYDFNEEINSRNITLISLGIALIVSFIICALVVNSYKHPKSISTMNYVDENSIVFTRRKDTFINTYTTKVKIERDNDDNNRSTTHTSSGGSSHGGSGGDF